MEALIQYYRDQFWSPGHIGVFSDYCIILLTLVPVWLVIWWMFALAGRFIAADMRSRVGTRVTLRVIWARAALILSFLLLIDIAVIWYFEKLSDWSAITPHATLSCIGAAVGMWAALRTRHDIKMNGRQLFKAKEQAGAA